MLIGTGSGEADLIGGFAAAAWVGSALAIGSAIASFALIREDAVSDS